MSRKLLLSLVATAALALPAHPATRLTYQLNGTPVPVVWQSSSFPLHYAVDRRVLAAKPGMDDAIARAVGEWMSVAEASITFQPDGAVDGVKAGKDGKNSITLVDDLFANQHYLAVTTNWYDDTGHLSEADIQIDGGTPAAGYDMQQLIAHELGHLLGLDHSAVLSAVMYPYIGKSGVPSLDSDDIVAITALYPKPAHPTGATLTGRVMGDSGPIFAAQVVALSGTGEPVATALTDQQGGFTIDGVPAGTYRLYAEPLDGPVDVQNLSGVWRTAKVKSFPTQFADGGAVTVEDGKLYGNIVVTTNGTVQLNPKWVGSFVPGTSDISLAASPVMLRPGDTVSLAVGGDGFVSGMTTFEVPNPAFHRVSDFTYSSNFITATYQIDAGAKSGSVSVLVKSGNESAALTGALRLAARTRQRVARK
jgi:predicted Zn-dependent protease